MTLTTHIAIAAAVTKSFGYAHPLLGFFAAIASHYLSDAIPHWDYSMHAIANDARKLDWDAGKASAFRRRILSDVGFFAIDGCLGTLAIIFLTRPSSHNEWLWIAGTIIGACLPDFLQAVYLAGVRFLKPLQRFHDFCHTKIKLGPYPLIGIPFQIIIALAAIYFLR